MLQGFCPVYLRHLVYIGLGQIAELERLRADGFRCRFGLACGKRQGGKRQYDRGGRMFNFRLVDESGPRYRRFFRPRSDYGQGSVRGCRRASTCE
jgi:hypothetical protein